MQPREEGAVVKQEGRDLDASQQRLVFRQGPEMDLPPSAMNGVSVRALPEMTSVSTSADEVFSVDPGYCALCYCDRGASAGRGTDGDASSSKAVGRFQQLLQVSLSFPCMIPGRISRFPSGYLAKCCKISLRLIGMYCQHSRLKSRSSSNSDASKSRENSTLRTYCEILSKLSCISPSAAGAVTTTLSGVLQKHSASQERLTEGYRLMSALWETACGLFTREIAESFEIHYRKLADDFNMAQESTMADVFTPAKSIKAPASHVEERHSRSTLTTADSKRKESTNSNYSGERKRRKLSVDTTERTKDHRRKRASTSSIDEVADMLDMKTKLEDLAKENKEVRVLVRFA